MTGNQELLDLIHEVQGHVPRDFPSDYCKGFDFAVSLFRRFAQGKDPFTLEIGGTKISLKRIDSDAE